MKGLNKRGTAEEIEKRGANGKIRPLTATEGIQELKTEKENRQNQPYKRPGQKNRALRYPVNT